MQLENKFWIRKKNRTLDNNFIRHNDDGKTQQFRQFCQSGCLYIPTAAAK